MNSGPVCLFDKAGKMVDAHQGRVYSVCSQQTCLFGQIAVVLAVHDKHKCIAWFPDAVEWLTLPQETPDCARFTHVSIM